MMESLLAALPAGEPDLLIFKAIFLTRLPEDIRSFVATQAKVMDSRQLAAYADTLWFARNQGKRSGRPVMAVTPATEQASTELAALETTVAALKIAPPQPRRGGRSRGGRGRGQPSKVANFVCWRHVQYQDRAHKCEDPARCSWSENGEAGQ